MVKPRNPIMVDEAINKVMRHKWEAETELVSLENCDLRRLAAPFIATHNIPFFHKSPYDGFAIRAEDTKYSTDEDPAVFEVIDYIGAGQLPRNELGEGQATRIMTGAKIPQGANCVVMLEDCYTYQKDGIHYMELAKKMEENQNIIKEGSELAKGTLLVDRGAIINPGIKALLATFGYHQVEVIKKPLIGVIATGTELLEPDEDLESGKIYNSNAYMILSQIKRAGGDPSYYGKLDDDVTSSYSRIKRVLQEVDILITTGGVSVGDFDLMPELYNMLGATTLFNKVAMRPGSVTTVAVKGKKLLFGLSGNPSACYVGFELFVRPMIRGIMHQKNVCMKRVKAKLDDDFPKMNPYTRYVRGQLSYQGRELYVQLAGIDHSNVVSSLAYTTCLIEIPGGKEKYEKGDELEVLLLEDMEGQANFR
ncbi:molybdopterin molybdotransferase MoeA [Virgibacillus salarius]